MITIIFYILGMLFAPRIMLGYILITLGYPIIGIISIILELLKAFDDE